MEKTFELKRDDDDDLTGVQWDGEDNNIRVCDRVGGLGCQKVDVLSTSAAVDNVESNYSCLTMRKYKSSADEDIITIIIILFL